MNRRLQAIDSGSDLPGYIPEDSELEKQEADSLSDWGEDWAYDDHDLRDVRQDGATRWTFDYIEEDDSMFETRENFPDSWLFKAVHVG